MDILSTTTNATISNNSTECAPAVATTAPIPVATVAASPPAATVPASVVTIPVPIVPNEDTYAYVVVKGSLHDYTSTVFGLNEAEIQALSKRFENGVRQAVNGVMVTGSPMIIINTLAQLGYKVICCSGEAEISWTMQREV